MSELSGNLYGTRSAAARLRLSSQGLKHRLARHPEISPAAWLVDIHGDRRPLYSENSIDLLAELEPVRKYTKAARKAA